MIRFNYIIGGNIELAVEAKLLPAEPDVNYQGGVEIESVKLNGMDVETDDIFIRDNRLSSNPHNRLNIHTLESLLEQEAMERASEENDNG